MGFVAPRHVGFSRTRDQTHVPCIGGLILNHCTTREVPVQHFLGLFRHLKWREVRVHGLIKSIPWEVSALEEDPYRRIGWGVGGQSAISSNLHPGNSTKEDSESISGEKQQKLSRRYSWDAEQHPTRQQRPRQTGELPPGHQQYEYLVSPWHFGRDNALGLSHHFLFLGTQEDYISQAPLKLGWVYFLANGTWAKALMQGFPRPGPTHIFFLFLGDHKAWLQVISSRNNLLLG